VIRAVIVLGSPHAMRSCVPRDTGAQAAKTPAPECPHQSAATQDRVFKENSELVRVFANVDIRGQIAREAVPVSRAPATTTASAMKLLRRAHASLGSLAKHAT
jgi:hypothetical protein